MQASELIKKLETVAPTSQVVFEVRDSDTSYTVDVVEFHHGFAVLISEEAQ